MKKAISLDCRKAGALALILALGMVVNSAMGEESLGGVRTTSFGSARYDFSGDGEPVEEVSFTKVGREAIDDNDDLTAKLTEAEPQDNTGDYMMYYPYGDDRGWEDMDWLWAELYSPDEPLGSDYGGVDPNSAPVYIRNWSHYDIDEVWLVSGGGPGVPLVRDLLTQDLSTLVPGGTFYNNEILVDIPLRHDPSIDPTPTPYYVLEYIQEELFFNGQAVYHADPRFSTGFAPGAIHVTRYSLVRETMFLFSWSGRPTSRFEQMLRGPDSELYLYRPGSHFSTHPEVDHGPILLQTLIDEGYGAYDPSQWGS